MTTARTPVEIIDDLTKTALQFNQNLGAIRSQQLLQQQIINIAKSISNALTILSANAKIEAGSAINKQLQANLAEISAPDAQLDELYKQWQQQAAKVDANANTKQIQQTKTALDGLKEDCKNASKDAKFSSMKQLIEKAEGTISRVDLQIEDAQKILNQQDNFKTKIPQIVKNAKNNLARVQEELKKSGLTQPVYAANVAVTFHGKSQDKPGSQRTDEIPSQKKTPTTTQGNP